MSIFSYIIAAICWILQARSVGLTAIVQFLGMLVLIFLTIFWGKFDQAIVLLILPIGFSTLVFGIETGSILAVLMTVGLIFTPTSVVPTLQVLRIITGIVAWGVVVMIWMTFRLVMPAIEWSKSGYEASQASLAQAREYQSQLLQSLNDLTEANANLIRLNQLAQNLRMTAEDERRIKQEFVANVSHELRTPLNMILGFCEVILNNSKTYGRSIPQALLSDLGIILRNGQHLSILIDDVLDLSQIDANKVVLNKEHVSLAELIDEAVKQVSPLFQSKNLFLQVDIASDLPLVWCDRIRIREVLLNLLSNAGRFTKVGGVIVQARKDDLYLKVSVADTGLGIAKEDQARLFQPFQQVDSSIRRQYGGTGLGLTISKGFVDLHDGKMWLESEKDKGTIFHFMLPIESFKPPVSSAARWLSPYQKRDEYSVHRPLNMSPVKPRMVVFEKGKTMKKLLGRYLPGLDLVSCEETSDVIGRLIETQAVALLVNDQRTFEFFEMLNQTKSLPFSIPAIVCAVPGEESTSQDLGVAGYLTKPIARDNLINALERLDSPIKTILLADDEPDVHQLVRRILTSSGKKYRLLRAEDGQQALDVLKEHKIDLILLDITMPGMDGFQFISVKNADTALRSVPVIMISAHDPQGQPIVTKAIHLLRGGGISTHQILDIIEAMLTILSPLGPSGPTKPVNSAE